MKLLRAVVFTVSIVLLGAGYALSQQAYFSAPPAYEDYIGQIDAPAVRMTALALLALCVVFPLLGKSEGGAGK